MNDFLLAIINFFYSIVPNYGVAIILFTIFVKLCLSPLDLKSRRSMKRMNDIKPKTDLLQKKYANDKEKLNLKMQELYKQEKINPLAGCLPMLLTLPILFAMFGAMRQIANEQLVRQFLLLINGVEPPVEPFLWIRNLWMPDTFSSPMMPDFNSLRAIGQDVWLRVSAALDGVQPLAFADNTAFTAYINDIPNLINASSLYQGYLQSMAGWTNVNVLLFKFTVFVQMNGYFVLPILAVATQYVSQKFMNPTAAPTPQQNTQAPNTGKTMMMLMPLMSLYFCMTSSAAFAIYWVMSNVIAAVQQVAFNRYFAWQDRKAAIAGEVGIK